MIGRHRLLLTGLLAVLISRGLLAGEPEGPPGEEKTRPSRVYVRAAWRDLDTQRGIGIVVGDVRFMAPGSDVLVMADAGVIWLKRKEVYLEGNIRMYQTLGRPVKAGDFDVPRPALGDRAGLEPRESLEKAGDLDDIIEAKVKKAILIDTRVPVSEAERLYVNWSDTALGGTAYIVKPRLRFAEADRVANWVVTAPSAEGIATYRIPVQDKNGKLTGKYERRSHYVMKNATFTTCTFKEPCTRFTSTYAEIIEGDYMAMKNVLFKTGDVPIMYFPYAWRDLEHKWPRVSFAAGSSSRLGQYASVELEFSPVRGVDILPRVEAMSKRGLGVGLGAEYEFGHDREIRGALDVFWLPNDTGTDELADTSRANSPWTPVVWPGPGPLPADIPLGTDNRYRVKFAHQQEYPEGVELDLELHKFSDAGIYREYFEEEFKTDKEPETRLLLKSGRDNWAVFVHLKKRINNFLTQTEYLPQFGFNMIAQPIGGGFLFSSDTELARVTTRFGDVFRRLGQTNAQITRIWLRRNEYRRPAALTLRQDDTDRLSGWRFDTVNIISRPFEWGIFDIEPYVGWRGSWFEHGVESIRGNYAAVTPLVGPALPAAVAAARSYTGHRTRSQVLAGGRIATQFHRTYDVSDRPVLRRFFKHGQRHIITPEITYTYESRPTKLPRHLPDNDTVTAQDGLHRINFALRNRWQTKWAPPIERDPRAPVGGEWHRRKLAVERAKESGPVNVIDLDVDIDLFLNPRRDNVHPRGQRVRRWSNFRTDLTFRPSRKTSFFLDTEFALEDAGSSGAGGFEVVYVGFEHRPRPDLRFSVRHDYHFHDASLLRFAADWELNPKWHLGLDVGQDFASGDGWDQTVEITRRFHEWELTFGYEFDKGKTESIGSIHIGPSRGRVHRPSWRFQPRSVQAFELAESAR